MSFSYDPKHWVMFSPRQSPEDFYAKMTQGLPEGTRLSLLFYDDGTPKEILFQNPLTAEIEQQFNFQYGFRSDGKHCDFELANTYPDAQKLGLSKIVNRHMRDLWEKMDVRSIGLESASVGSYAWPRLGFVPWSHEWRGLRNSIGQRLDWMETEGKQPLPATYVDTLRKALESDDPKTLWFIVDQSYMYEGVPMGKALTLPGNSLPAAFPQDEPPFKQLKYHATLDLRDADCVGRHDAYLGKAPATFKPRAEMAP